MHKTNAFLLLMILALSTGYVCGSEQMSPAKAGEILKHKKLVETRNQPTEVVEKADKHYFVAFEKAAFGTVEVEIAADPG